MSWRRTSALFRGALALLICLLALPPGGARGAKEKAEFVPGQIIVRFRRGLATTQSNRIVQAAGARAVDELAELNLRLVEVPPGQERAKIEELLQDPMVEAAELNYVVRALVDPLIPNDTYYGSQWALGLTYAGRIRAPTAWSMETGSSSVVIAIIDTGVSLDHDDLDAKVVAGYDFINDDPDPSDDHWLSHGTHVAGIAAAESNNAQGVAGVSWGARIMPIKVLGSDGFGTFYDVIDGIYYAAQHGAKVINMSLGAPPGYITPEELTSLQAAIDYAHAAGCVVVAAAGNDGTPGVFYPAACDNVIAVAATTSSDIRWYVRPGQGSSYGPEIDVAAPGVSIYSTKRFDSYGSMTGTSMASPHVTGLASLVLSVKPDHSPDQVEALIENGAEDKGASGWDQYYGWGRIDAFETLYPISPGSMSGTVRDNRDISVYDVALSLVAGGMGSTQTDLLGQYTFSDLISGTYGLQAEKETYEDLPPMKSIQVVSGTETSGLDFVMPSTDNLMGSNWDFEAGDLSTWVISSTSPAPQPVEEPHTGDYSARLGGGSASGGLSAFYAQVDIPGAESMYEPTLSFFYRYQAGDASDHFRAWIGDGGGSWLADALPARHASVEGWTHAWFDVSDYAGTTIRVYFEVLQEDASDPSQAYVDEVSLGKASGGSQRVYMPVAFGSWIP